jgi:hypothetical protein
MSWINSAFGVTDQYRIVQMGKAFSSPMESFFECISWAYVIKNYVPNTTKVSPTFSAKDVKDNLKIFLQNNANLIPFVDEAVSTRIVMNDQNKNLLNAASTDDDKINAILSDQWEIDSFTIGQMQQIFHVTFIFLSQQLYMQNNKSNFIKCIFQLPDPSLPNSLFPIKKFTNYGYIILAINTFGFCQLVLNKVGNEYEAVTENILDLQMQLINMYVQKCGANYLPDTDWKKVLGVARPDLPEKAYRTELNTTTNLFNEPSLPDYLKKPSNIFIEPDKEPTIFDQAKKVLSVSPDQTLLKKTESKRVSDYKTETGKIPSQEVLDLLEDQSLNTTSLGNMANLKSSTEIRCPRNYSDYETWRPQKKTYADLSKEYSTCCKSFKNSEYCLAIQDNIDPTDISRLEIEYNKTESKRNFIENLETFYLNKCENAGFATRFINRKRCKEIALFLRNKRNLIRNSQVTIISQFNNHYTNFENLKNNFTSITSKAFSGSNNIKSKEANDLLKTITDINDVLNEIDTDIEILLKETFYDKADIENKVSIIKQTIQDIETDLKKLNVLDDNAGFFRKALQTIKNSYNSLIKLVLPFLFSAKTGGSTRRRKLTRKKNKSRRRKPSKRFCSTYM